MSTNECVHVVVKSSCSFITTPWRPNGRASAEQENTSSRRTWSHQAAHTMWYSIYRDACWIPCRGRRRAAADAVHMRVRTGLSLKRGMPRRCGKMAHSALSPEKVSSGHPSDRVCCFDFHPLWPVCREAMGFILGSCLMPGPSIMGFTITGLTITGVHCQGGFIGAAATGATDATDPKA